MLFGLFISSAVSHSAWRLTLRCLSVLRRTTGWSLCVSAGLACVCVGGRGGSRLITPGLISHRCRLALPRRCFQTFHHLIWAAELLTGCRLVQRPLSSSPLLVMSFPLLLLVLFLLLCAIHHPSLSPQLIFSLSSRFSPTWHVSLCSSSLSFFSRAFALSPHHCPPLFYLPLITCVAPLCRCQSCSFVVSSSHTPSSSDCNQPVVLSPVRNTWHCLNNSSH